MTTNETTLRTTHHGKIAESNYKNVGGKDWQITTMKRSNGIISCIAQEGILADDNSFSFEMFGSKRITLAEEKRTATEKALLEVHNKGLAMFDQMKQEGKFGENKTYEIEEGQILFLNGYGQDEFSHDRLAVYKIEKARFGMRYYTVNLETLELSSHDRVKNIKEKFGIGIYYKEGDKISTEDLNNFVIDAMEKQKATNRTKEAEAILNKQLREAKIEEGKKLVKIPACTKAVIVAILKKNESDIQTDYFSHSTERTVYLSFSSHERDLFPEMRKAAERFEETKHLGINKGIFKPRVVFAEDVFNAGGRTHFKGEVSDWHRKYEAEKTFTTKEEAENFIKEKEIEFGAPHPVTIEEGKQASFVWNIYEEEIEHREKYSMGSGYWLGTHSHSGWEVRKENIDITNENALNRLYLAAAEGRFFCNDQKGEEKENISESLEPVSGNGLEIVIYSEKSFAVFGDTKPVKDQLGNNGLGGSFNRFLKHPVTGEKTAGWIFPLKKLDEVKKFFNL